MQISKGCYVQSLVASRSKIDWSALKTSCFKNAVLSQELSNGLKHLKTHVRVLVSHFENYFHH